MEKLRTDEVVKSGSPIISDFDKLILAGIAQAESEKVSTETTREEKLGILFLLILGGLLYFVGFFITPWPIESYSFAFIPVFGALLWGSMFIVSARLRWETLSAQAVVLAWVYVPMIVFLSYLASTFLADAPKSAWNDLFENLTVIWGGASLLLAVLISIAAVKELVLSKRA